jgi:lactoylglutathione lyase
VRIAKPAIDVGVYTHNKAPMLEFWQHEIGLPFHETLPVGRGVQQLRHGIGDSILKINHSREPLPVAPATGYRHLTLAKPEITTPRDLTDPDGNGLTLVPPGHNGVDQLQIRVAVRVSASVRVVHDLQPGHRRRPLSLRRITAADRARRERLR